MIDIPPELIAFVGVVGSAGAAFGVATAKANRTEAWLKDVNIELDQHNKDDTVAYMEVVQRLTRIETKIDGLKEK